MNISMILAVDEKNGLGKNNTLAWDLPGELKYFKNITSTTNDLAKLNAVVMGKNTWLSIPSKYRPLSNRVNCILDRDLKIDDSKGSKIDDMVLYYKSFESCIESLSKKDNIENIIIIGGASVYNYINNSSILNKIYITRIQGDFKCDVFYDGIPDSFHIDSYTGEFNENGIKYRFETWVKN